MDTYDLPVLQMVGSAITGLAYLLLLVGTVIVFVKRKDLGSGLLLAGSLASFICYIISYLGIIWASGAGVDTLLKAQGILSVISGLAYLIFAMGMVVLGLQLRKNLTGQSTAPSQ